MDILFIHVPKFNDHIDSLGEATFINIVPSGVFALADYLEKKGFSTGILHLGIEWILRGKFDPSDQIIAKKPRVIALSLHWHHQSYDVIETARSIKKNFPHIPLVLGGLTASYFAEEIMEKYPFIDFVIKGDAEIPLDMLMRLIAGGGNHAFLPKSGNKEAREGIHSLENICLQSVIDTNNGSGFSDSKDLWDTPNSSSIQSIADIPNLYFRREGKVERSPLTYSISREIFNSLIHYRYELMIDGDFYRQEIGIPSFWLKGKDVEFHQTQLHRFTNLFFPVIGRGCPRICAWCGKEKRDFTMFRDPEVVADSIQQAQRRGVENLYFTFDPCPEADNVYIEIFRVIKKMNLNMFAYFESWNLPSITLACAFKDTFPDGIIAISPETGVESLRKSNRSGSFSNAKFYETLDRLLQLNIALDLFFSVGIPGENEDSFKGTVEMMAQCRARYKNIQDICLFNLSLEPGSPWFEDPDKYGIIAGLKRFEDYYKVHGALGKGSYSLLGYFIPRYFRDTDKCQNMDSFESAIIDLRKKFFDFNVGDKIS